MSSKALICGVALAAIVVSGVALGADLRVPSGRAVRGGDHGQQGDRDRGRVDLDRGRRDYDGPRRDEPRDSA